MMSGLYSDTVVNKKVKCFLFIITMFYSCNENFTRKLQFVIMKILHTHQGFLQIPVLQFTVTLQPAWCYKLRELKDLLQQAINNNNKIIVE